MKSDVIIPQKFCSILCLIYSVYYTHMYLAKTQKLLHKHTDHAKNTTLNYWQNYGAIVTHTNYVSHTLN